MTVDFSAHPTDEVSRFSISTKADITIQIAERDGHQFIVIKEQRPSQSPSSAEHAVEIPAALLPELKRAVAALEQSFGDDDQDEPQQDLDAGASKTVSFAHQSEQEFARILDFYHINWVYEPRTFAIEWDGEGNVVSSFTPDFYLPDHDLYVELTTLKQALVTRKNRKVRLLKQLYPDVNIKVLYASDYRKLIEKFAASGKKKKQKR
ncbi:MAG TPA: hypothetical protein VNO14_17400 [Blastocatellia bacterium]|nr:hypothetical protein [Blastocatellia bacterium]